MRDLGGVLSPILGGPDQKLNRLGNRFFIDVTMPPMQNDSVAMDWIASLLQARRLGAVLNWPLLDFSPGTTGSPLVNGGSQIGTTLVMDGLAASYHVTKGQFFSIVASGRRYVHIFAASATANGSGQLNATIEPGLRLSPPDNSVIEIATPKIEGFLDGDEQSWTVSTARHIGLQFRISEAE